MQGFMIYHYAGVLEIDNWGGGVTLVYLCSQTVKQSISKEINCAGHKYMNILPPPPQLSIFWRPCLYVIKSLHTETIFISATLHFGAFVTVS